MTVFDSVIGLCCGKGVIRDGIVGISFWNVIEFYIIGRGFPGFTCFPTVYPCRNYFNPDMGAGHRVGKEIG